MSDKIKDFQSATIQRLYRRYVQAVERERASQYADPLDCLQGHTSYERSLPVSQWVQLNRASRSREDVWTDYHNLD